MVFCSHVATTPLPPDSVESWWASATCCRNREESRRQHLNADEWPSVTTLYGCESASDTDVMYDLLVVSMYEYDERRRGRRGSLAFYEVRICSCFETPSIGEGNGSADAFVGTDVISDADLRNTRMNSGSRGNVSATVHVDYTSCSCGTNLLPLLLVEDTRKGWLEARWLCDSNLPPCSNRRCTPLESFQGIVACVGTDCAIHAFRITGSEDPALPARKKLACDELARVAVCEDLGPSTIGLAMDAFRNQTKRLVLCCSDGTVGVVDELTSLISKWSAHSVETWSVLFDPEGDGNVILTGADDCSIRLWDIRQSCNRPCSSMSNGAPSKQKVVKEGSCSARSWNTISDSESDSYDAGDSYSNPLIATNSRTHSMGVTSLTFVPNTPALVLTGSYDGNVRAFDKRKLHDPLWERAASGGIWRLKWTSFGYDYVTGARSTDTRREPFLLIAACHGGCEVWESEGDGAGAYMPLVNFTGHNSMVYGITPLPYCPSSRHLSSRGTRSICRHPDSAGYTGSVHDVSGRKQLEHSSGLKRPTVPLWVASCSFYDKKLCVWRAL